MLVEEKVLLWRGEIMKKGEEGEEGPGKEA